MDKDKQIRNFVSRFQWKRMWLKGFRILRDEEGIVEGDCKSFAFTVAWIMAGKSVPKMIWDMLICKTVIWVVWSGEGHAATWVNGKGWICNIYPEFSPKTGNTRLFPAHPLLFIWLYLGFESWLTVLT